MTLKVIQFLPSLRGGGVEVGTLEVAKALVEAGHQSLVVSAGGPMVERLEQEGSIHIEWDLGKKSPLSFRHIWPLRRWLVEQQADILHVRSRMPAWIVYLAWKGMPEKARPRFMSTMHGLHSVSAYSEIMCRGERVIAVSNTVKDYIASHYPKTDMARVQVVNRGISDEEYPRDFCPEENWLMQWKETFPQFNGKRLICLPGRLTRLKGHAYFLRLMQKLCQRFDDVHGIVVGSEDPKRQNYAEELYAQLKDMGLQDSVTFTGGRSDMKNIYSQSAMVLSLSSKPESFGRTTTEALSMGVPVVGFDHGGVGEQLQSLFPLGMVPCFDEDVLLNKVEALLNKPEKPKKNDCYLKSKMLAQTLAIYQELASEA
ncbi:glycosyltransferase involved in cell wall biosynthesis [Pseudoteredinibacter isoporae]|uniref:Glycosyltransferase involved in cell wall biosynthesis n=1 Tax=Pseudoteredinibacter isoporae TaxID=570281 RepID=A0A7X0JV66_9GAMM|nr:glycosyltransferase involved in cell wall biosynthesis [Pseudoteredinibacter isoporae]